LSGEEIRNFFPLPEFKILETTLTNKIKVQENIRGINPGYAGHGSRAV
jgi:hypothetical protein